MFVFVLGIAPSLQKEINLKLCLAQPYSELTAANRLAASSVRKLV